MNQNSRKTARRKKNRPNALASAAMAHHFEDVATESNLPTDGMLSKVRIKLGSIADTARSAAATARERATEMLHGAQDSAHHMAERTRDRMIRLRDQSSTLVHEHPGKVVLASIVGGLLLGYLLRSRGNRT